MTKTVIRMAITVDANICAPIWLVADFIVTVAMDSNLMQVIPSIAWISTSAKATTPALNDATIPRDRISADATTIMKTTSLWEPWQAKVKFMQSLK